MPSVRQQSHRIRRLLGGLHEHTCVTTNPMAIMWPNANALRKRCVCNRIDCCSAHTHMCDSTLALTHLPLTKRRMWSIDERRWNDEMGRRKHIDTRCEWDKKWEKMHTSMFGKWKNYLYSLTDGTCCIRYIGIKREIKRFELYVYS